jgi:hypothetical protein
MTTHISVIKNGDIPCENKKHCVQATQEWVMATLSKSCLSWDWRVERTTLRHRDSWMDSTDRMTEKSRALRQEGVGNFELHARHDCRHLRFVKEQVKDSYPHRGDPGDKEIISKKSTK